VEPEPQTLEDVVESYLASRKRGEHLDTNLFLARHAEHGPDLEIAIEAALALESTAAPRASREMPARIGNFRLAREVGRGGMGVVFEAIEEPLGRRVALKVLPAELLASTSARARFRREAELAARLEHPAIATVFGAGVDDERPWIAMRFVEGATLARAIDRSRAEALACVSIPGAEDDDRESAVAKCLARVAWALQAAHEQGVVHRDVKPSNIVVGNDGAPVLLDFGLALPEEPDGASVTRTGDTAGTPAYFAPEHVAGEGARSDARTDVYAVGVTLYECLTLKRPFEAPTAAALYRAIASGVTTNVRAVNGTISRDLAVVVATAMERDRSRRYASAAALAADLEACVAGRPISARPVPLAGKVLRWARREQRQAWLAALLIVATITSAAFGGTWWASRDEVRDAETVARHFERDEALAAGFVALVEDRNAETEFLRAEALDPANLEALAGLALARIGNDRTESADDLLARAPSSPGFEALRAYSRGQPVTQDVDGLAECRLPALDLFLVGVAISRQAERGPASQRSADQGRALRMLDEAVVRSPRARLMMHTMRAAAASDARDEVRTRSAVAALLALWPESGQALLSAGTALRHFDPATAEPVLLRAAELMPENSAPFQVLGNTYTELGDLASAERWHWLALARRPLAETNNSLAKCLVMRNCADEAMAAWQRALALDRRHQSSLFNYAQCLYHLARDFGSAEIYLETLIQLDPEDFEARLLLGSCLCIRGDYSNARAHLTRCIEMRPSNAVAWDSLAEVERKSGSQAEARAALEQGLLNSPGDLRLMNSLGELGRDE
jgi:tetratricopeptide (TPR) repeat protein